MKRDGLRKIMESDLLTKGEKRYIFDHQWRHGGSFSHALYEAIGRADHFNLERLRLGFPDEVQGFLAWTRGDLHERASAIAGGDCGYIEAEPEDAQ